MKKSDELDRSRLAAYAWKLHAPGAREREPAGSADDIVAGEAEIAGAWRRSSPPAEEALDWQKPSPFEGDERERAAWRDEVRRGATALADNVDRAWALSHDAQIPAMMDLTIQAEKLGIGLCAMVDYPLQSVRLLRLAVRCLPRLQEEARQIARFAAAWMSFAHPEAVDLLVEVALSEDRELAASLMIAFVTGDRGKPLARMEGASARFVKVLEDGPSFIARRIALDWLRIASRRDAVPALRRALRLPHFVIRYRAFDLLENRYPDAVEVDDVLFLLEEAVIRPPPEVHGDEVFRATADFPEKLGKAVARLRPPAALDPLRRIAEHRCIQSAYRLDAFDASWAMGVLAATFPDDVLPRIDEKLRYIEWDRRMIAVEAAARLPDDLAWPRLLAAAADGVPEIAERAQAAWLERRGSLCPLDELAGVDLSLLDGPPDDTFRSRLSLLRRSPLEARAAMVEVLFAEAPSPAALPLLLFASMDSNLWDLKPRPGLPENRKAFTRRLVAGFGARAVTGLCSLAACYAGQRWDWFDALLDVARKGELPPETHDRVREVAAERFLEATGHGRHAPLALLARLGAPLSCLEKICAISQDPSEEDYIRNEAADALASLPEGAGRVESTLMEALDAAQRAKDHRRFGAAAVAALRRKIPAAIERAERFLAERCADKIGDRALTAALRGCAAELQSLGRLPASFYAGALKLHGTQAFAVAAGRSHFDASEEVRADLFAAMRSPDPETAAEAMSALLWALELDPKSPLVRGVAARASAPLRAGIVAFLLMREPPDAAWWPWIEEALLSDDRSVTALFHHRILPLARDAAIFEKLRAVRTRVKDAVLCEQLEDLFEHDAAAYWQDEEEDSEDSLDWDSAEDEDDPELDKLC